MARETYGDHFKLSYLNMAFKKKILEIQKAATEEATQTYWLMDYNKRTIEKEGYQTMKYFKVFNICCKLAFFTTIIKLQNYNNSIISMPTFDFFVNLSPKCMPRLWGKMFSQRNVDGRLGDKNNTLSIIRRKRQVLLQIFTLR